VTVTARISPIVSVRMPRFRPTIFFPASVPWLARGTFDFILGGATTEEVGTGAGTLNAVQQSSGAIGVAALGTVFFARVNHGGTPAFDHAGELVIGLATVLFLITFALVWLLPKHAQHSES